MLPNERLHTIRNQSTVTPLCLTVNAPGFRKADDRAVWLYKIIQWLVFATFHGVFYCRIKSFLFSNSFPS